jgi:hypothetical protein
MDPTTTHHHGNNLLDSSRLLFDHAFGSTAGAGFNSHGREAVAWAPKDEIEARRAGSYLLRINAAPSALSY